jgi:hypothetical protein
MVWRICRRRSPGSLPRTMTAGWLSVSLALNEPSEPSHTSHLGSSPQCDHHGGTKALRAPDCDVLPGSLINYTLVH